jgi:uncharacterized membrane protein YdbT with pleckstrin-like domain
VVNFWLHVVCWLLFFLVVPIFISLWKWLQVRCRVYEVTTERIKVTQGVFTKRTDELELYRVRDTTMVQPFIHRLFKKGNVVLKTTDATTPTMTIEAVPCSEEMREKLRQAIEACRERKGVRISELTGVVDSDMDKMHGS